MEKMRNKDLMLQSVLNTIPGGIATYRVRDKCIEGIEMEYTSEGVPKLTGRTMEEYKQWIADGIFTPSTTKEEELPTIHAIMTEKLVNKKPFYLNVHLKRKDGSYVFVTINSVWGYDKLDKSSIYYVVYLDLSMQEKARMAERRALKADASNEAKSTFLSRMSHEIRTPMTAIIGMTKLAQDTAKDKDTKHYLSLIDDSSNYLLSLINDILDVSRIESGKFVLQQGWIPLASVLESVYGMIIPLASRKGIRFIHPEPEKIMGYEAFLDKVRVEQVFVNLLSNSFKFTPSGGTVTLAIKNVSSSQGNATDLITISDNGCGMSEEFLQHIFEPFAQERNVYSDMVKGTGLGLALVKRIIDHMGGTIKVKSELGKGSSFMLTIPYQWKRRKVVEQELSDDDSLDFTGKTILVVDDNQLNMEIAKRLLERKHATLLVAHNGQEAVGVFFASPLFSINAILMDVRMPVMDGLEATRRIRSLKRKDADLVPIIAMTANAFDEDRRQTKEAGMNDHISKPFVTEEMYRTIMSHMGKTDA